MSGREQTDAAEQRVLAGDHTHDDIERQVMKRLFDVDAKPQVRFGRYEVTGRLGQGAMGTVYEARDPELDRLIAIKVLHGTIAETERTALIAEARAMARLHHPNVVAVYDVGEQDGQVFIAMERVLGTSLRAWAEKHKPQWRAAATLYREAARGLAAAHAAGVAHRDFKPDNVMVAKDGRVAVADFGLASRGLDVNGRRHKTVGDDDETSSTASVAGTPAYLPPERINGGPGDAAGDQFSFCVSLHETLYGARPFIGRGLIEMLATITAGDRTRPRNIGDVPSRIRAIVDRGLAPKPSDRFASMDDLVAALDRALVPWRRRVATPLVLGVILVSAAGGAVLVEQGRTSACEREAAGVNDVWDEDTRARIETALRDSGVVYAQATWEAVDARIGPWAQRWSAGRREACLGRNDDAWATRRTDCYEGLLAELGGLADGLAGTNAKFASQATRAALLLPEPELCSDDEWLRSAALPPPNAPAAEVARLVRRELARAATLKSSGHLDQAITIAQEQLRTAEATQHPPLVAEALVTLGRTRESKGDFDSARVDYERAFQLATESDAPRLAALSGGAMAWLRGVQEHEHAVGRAWATAIGGFLKRTGSGGAAIEARHLETIARIHMQRSELDQAAEVITQARDLAKASIEVASPIHDRLLTAEASIRNRRGEYRQSATLTKHAIDRIEAREGTVHPSLLAPLQELLRASAESGALQEANSAALRGVKLARQLYDDNNILVAAALMNAGVVARALGDLDDAQTKLEAARAIQITQLGPDHPDVLGSTLNLGVIASDRGDVDAALRFANAAVDALGEDTANDPDSHVTARLSRAHALTKLGRLDDAVSDYQRALELAESGLGADHHTTALIVYGLATVDAKQGRYDQALARVKRVDGIYANGEVSDAEFDAERRAFRLELEVRLGEPGR